MFLYIPNSNLQRLLIKSQMQATLPHTVPIILIQSTLSQFGFLGRDLLFQHCLGLILRIWTITMSPKWSWWLLLSLLLWYNDDHKCEQCENNYDDYYNRDQVRSASFTPLGEGSRPAACSARGAGGNNQVGVLHSGHDHCDHGQHNHIDIVQW